MRERVVSVDEARRRLCYTVLDGLFEHHSPSMQVMPVDVQTCRFVWITDGLPDAAGETIAPLVEQGSQAMRANLEAAAGRAAAPL